MNEACKKLDSRQNWLKKIEKLKDKERDLYRVFSIGDNDRENSSVEHSYLIKFNKDAIYHLLDKEDVNKPIVLQQGKSKSLTLKGKEVKGKSLQGKTTTPTPEGLLG